MRIPEGARVVSICVSQDVDRWYASMCLQDVPLPDPLPRESKSVGVDLNVARTVCSDGTEYAVPARLQVLERRQRRAQRVLSRRQRGSNRQQVAKVRVAKVHRAIRRVRENWLHEVTTDLVRKNTRIVIEDLNVQGMTRSAKGTVANPGRNVRQKAGLNRAILNAGFGEFRRQLTYKGKWYGTEIVVADQWFASSKLCSCCGVKNESLTLADRIFRCGACGLVIDRDLNAAINLERVPSVATPSEVPAGSGDLTDVERNKPGRSKRRKPELITRVTVLKRQRNTPPRGDSDQPQANEVHHARAPVGHQRRTRAGPRRSERLGDA